MKRDEIQQEALNAIKERSTLAISMGVGKTLIALKHLSGLILRSDRIYNKFLIVIPKVSLKKSWLDEMSKHGFESLKDHVEFSTYRSLHKQRTDYGCVVLDECHSILPSHVKWLCEYDNDILGLTGTPPKSPKSDKYQILNTFAPVVYKYLVDEAVKDNILNDYQLVIHKIKLSDIKDKLISLPNGARFRVSEKESYDRLIKKLDDSEGFRQREKAYILLLNALKSFDTKTEYVKKLLKYIDNKCIIFCNTQEQADTITTYSYHSKNPNSKRNLEWFEQGRIEKLSCVQQLNEGINIPDLKTGIIMHSYANERQATQRIGRLLRLPVDQTACIHIIVFEDTLDEIWINKALESFDEENIYYAKTNLI